MLRSKLLSLLQGGDRRSIGRSNQVVAIVLREPQNFAELIQLLWSDDPLVRMRAVDAAEKITLKKVELLAPYKAELLGLLSEAEQQELRWHLALLVPRLPLTKSEARRAAMSLRRYLEDRSSIVKTFALQALFDLTGIDPSLRESTRSLLEDSTRTGTAAMKARSRKLLKKLPT